MALEFPRREDGAERDIEKARRMAEAEDPAREFLSEFNEYIKDPLAYQNQERERLATLREQNIFTTNRAEDFMYLCQEGVHADDLEYLAEVAGETEGDLHDFEQTLKKTNPLMLRAFAAGLRWWEERTWKTLEHAQAKHGNKINIMGDQRGVVVSDTLRKLEVNDDPEALAQNKLYLKLDRLFLMREKVRQALNSKHSGESAVAQAPFDAIIGVSRWRQSWP
jgi:hypothetical protein